MLRGDPAMTRALIDSIERRWKFTSGVLSWHPDDTVSEDQKGSHERIRARGLRRAGSGSTPYPLGAAYPCRHHELHFPHSATGAFQRQGFNACPPGWHRADVFRDLFNWREGWRVPTTRHGHGTSFRKRPTCSRREWRDGARNQESDRDRAKEVIHAFLKEKVARRLVRDREDVLNALKEQGLRINREGRDYISVIAPDNGMKMRFGEAFTSVDGRPKPPRRTKPKKKEKNGAAYGRPSATGF
ncbi:MAG: hypothetical protein ACLSAH_23605 [Bilophila wadsworthia]